MPEDGRYRIDKQQARRAFDAAASTYDEAAELQYEIGDRMMERLDFIRLQPHRILDLGAGTGKFSAALLKRYRKAEVVAVDLAPAMLARTQNRGGWLRKPSCICADAEQLPFADDSFEFIFSNLMLQWCVDLEHTLTELRRVLAPGGRALVALVNPPHERLSELMAAGSELIGQPLYWPTRARMRAWTEAAGFEVLEQTAILRLPLLIPAVLTVARRPERAEGDVD